MAEKQAVQDKLTYKKIFLFWLPLAATWLMMSIEGPYNAAIISRTPNPEYNLAAYGVAFAFALIMEAPVMMLLSASTALVRGYKTYIKLRNFSLALSIAMTAAMLFVVIPPVADYLLHDVIGLIPEISHLTHLAIIVMLPWPGAIGMRRFYQGVLIANNRTKYVAFGTFIRILSMSVTAMLLWVTIKPPGVLIGAFALSTAVLVEAAASYLFVRKVIPELKRGEDDEDITYRGIISFYHPLALTAFLALGIQPLVTFFIGKAPQPIESLAALPVINAFLFIFRSLGLSYQEVGLALMGKDFINYKKLRNFAYGFSGMIFLALSVIAFSPLAMVWFHDISGLSLSLALFALLPLQIQVLLPVVNVAVNFQRAVIMSAKQNSYITWATVVETTTILTVMALTVYSGVIAGLIGAALAFTLGRLLSSVYMMMPVRKIKAAIRIF
ncbi:MAG: hypothetical protein K9I69_03805 [Ignavibacteriales bacterium]|nr:hypothetical protein [Ignavibacteriales bacterium]MCF8314995.1 hypothetical protein [Ignavibacteriales bacterium]MCF8436009.1 hypothetical protein [Ignavibacteriales bacterium]